MAEQTGFTLPYEEAAMHGEEMPEGLCIYDQAAFQALRYLYKSYRSKVIDREAAAKEKLMIRKALDDEIKMAQYQQDLAFHQAEQNRLAEAAKIACRKDPTPENALNLVCVLDGIKAPPKLL